MPNTDDMKGRAKEAAGDLTGDEKLKQEGRVDRAAGKVKEAVDTGKEKLSEAADRAREKLDRD